MTEITFHGHATFTVETGDGTRLVVDPWFDGNPRADVSLDQVRDVDFVLVTHGHADHFSDAVPLLRRTGATLITSFEIAAFVEEQGVEGERIHPLSVGGGYRFPFGYARMTPALHGPEVAGSDGRVACAPAGFWLDLDDVRLYHAGDTALTTDMELLRGRVDVALLPIGDNFTMGPEEAARAVEMIEPDVVVPMHYGTFELIEQDPEDFRALVGDAARVRVLEPGQGLSLP